jgi:NAD(P)-dependent dehydrogenase (short-subunit alcohol dehydrogenase family)
MGNTLRNKTIVAVGRGIGIVRAITVLARSAGARVIVAGRNKAKLAGAYHDPGVSAEVVDITDDTSIALSPSGLVPSIMWSRPHQPARVESLPFWTARACSCHSTRR